MLTPKQENFCLAYLETGNASEAYRRAYCAEKMKPETINRMGKAMIDDPKIAARIAELRKPVVEKVQIGLERVLQELFRLSTFDPRKLLNDDGTPKPLNELDDDTAAAIGGMKIRTFKGEDGDSAVVTEYKLPDKGANLDRLMKHLGGYEKDNRQKADAVLALVEAVAGANSGGPAFPIVHNR